MGLWMRRGGWRTWASRERVCCRSCAHPLPVEADIVLAALERICRGEYSTICSGAAEDWASWTSKM